MRTRETIERELRLLATVRNAYREHGYVLAQSDGCPDEVGIEVPETEHVAAARAVAFEKLCHQVELNLAKRAPQPAAGQAAVVQRVYSKVSQRFSVLWADE